MAAGEAPKSIRASIYIDGKPAQGTLKDIKQDAVLLKRELDNLTVGTQAFKDKAKELSQVNATLESVKKEVNGLGGAFGFLKTEIGKLGVLATGVLGFQFVTSQFQSIISANAKLSDSLADVRQTTGLTEEAARSLNAELKKIDTRTARNELLKIAEIGGQFNVPTEQLKDFVVQMDKANVVLGSEFKGGAEQITTELALLRNNFTDIKTARVDEDLGHIGNALIVLAQQGAATAPVVTEFAKRLSPLITTAHLSSGAILGLGATMQELAVDPERGGTGVVKLFAAMSANVYGFAQVAGLAADQFKKLMNNSPMEAFSKVLQGFAKGGNNISVMNDLLKELDINGTGSREALVKLSQNIDLLTQRSAQATEALTKQDAITTQFDIKNNNFAGTLDKLSKKFNAMTSNASLQSFFSGLVVFASQAIDVLGGFITVIGSVTKVVVLGTVAYLAYTGALLAAKLLQKDWITLLVATETYTKLAAIAQAAWNVVVVLFTKGLKEARLALIEFNLLLELNPMGVLIGTIAALTVAVILFSKDATDALKEVTDKAREATDQFNEQKKAVDNLQRNMSPLLDRYDQLTKKGKLNRDEQTELKKIIGQLADVMPTAVTQWDKYGNALSINTGKAREFIDAQKAMLSYMNKAAIADNKKAGDAIDQQSKNLLNDLKRGTFIQSASGGSGGASTTVRPYSVAEIQAIRAQLKDLAAQKKGIDDTIRGLSGSYLDSKPDTPKPAAGGNDTNTQLKLTDMTVGQLKAHVEDLVKQLDTFKKGSADYVRITKELTEARKILKQVDKDSGLNTGGEKDPQKKINEILNQSKAISQVVKEFNAQQLADQQSKNQKEIDQVVNKYDAEIAKVKAGEVKIRQSKELSDTQKKAELAKHDDEIAQLETGKKQALNQVIIRQEKELSDKIRDLRTSLGEVHETELQKERDRINNFYDDLQKDAADNWDVIIDIELARAKDLTDARVREEQRFQDAVQEINEEGVVTEAKVYEIKLAKINKKYDDEIEALKKKFSKELQATKEFQDAVDKVNKNRQGEIEQTEEEKAIAKKKKLSETEIQAVKEVSRAVFSISNQNRTADTNAKIKQLEAQKDVELSNANLTQSQKDAINQKYAKQEADIKLKAWKAQQAADIEQAIINGAVAMTKVSAQTGILSIAFDPIVAIATAAQIAIIAAQKPPEFAEGGTTDTNPAGYVSKATLFRNSASGRPFVAGEAGREWIAPNWMVKSPRYANIIGMLESARQEKRAFAAGGYNGAAPVPAAMDNGRLDRLEAMMASQLLINQRQAQINEIPVSFNTRTYDKVNERNVQIKTNSKA